ncbi:ATP-binding protein [Burkholderia plantarii]|uniref:histidine kinase n=1 Tax=Burkholderia plantarii TaxID=41899 RepID=A0A0B6RRD7_BURPL|nr:ATP-binding protein [Burkholderia plantarii]AJK45938.1 putative sensor-like histidine kinase R01002 [Burkholderia plantarii]
MAIQIQLISLDSEEQVAAARRQARVIAAGLGFAPLDQTRIASAASEVARNALVHAGGGTVSFEFDVQARPQALTLVVRDDGPGIRDLQAVLDGSHRSGPGVTGNGIAGCRRLMDHCAIESTAGRGTTVTMLRVLPADRPPVAAAAVQALADALRGDPPASLASPAAPGSSGPQAAPAAPRPFAQEPRNPFAELQQQNHELLTALTELQARQEDLSRLTSELEATNRGVVALYAELDERAEELRRVDSLKTRFLSDMSHELRTPLSSIRALSNLLLNRLDGELTSEQERQVLLIRKSAEDLTDIVNDLLDLAKIEAGRTDVLPVPFEPHNMVAAVRATLAPLLSSPTVQLIFDDMQGLPSMLTDEAKVTQILRNFVSNALKFTERGEIRVSARLQPDDEHITFFVSDTGIGIAQEDQELIFEAFGQVRSHLQQRVKGTGLGLPLCRNLAALLGGEVGMESRLGEGSTFYVTLPLRFDSQPPAAPDGTATVARARAAGGLDAPISRGGNAWPR